MQRAAPSGALAPAVDARQQRRKPASALARSVAANLGRFSCSQLQGHMEQFALNLKRTAHA